MFDCLCQVGKKKHLLASDDRITHELIDLYCFYGDNSKEDVKLHAFGNLYRCHRIKLLTRFLHSFILKTDIKEEFRVIPKSVQVAAGDSIVLQCSAPKAQPEPSIRWLKNNQPLSTATAGDFFIGDNQQQSLTPPPSPSSSSSHHQFQAQNGDKLERIKVLSSGFLRILNVVVEDQGRYSCVAENMAGSRESPSAILNVYGKKF